VTHQEEKEDGPFDDATHWVGNLPKESTDNPEHTTERDNGREHEPDVQRKELPAKEGQEDKPS